MLGAKNTSTTVPQFVQGRGRDSTDLQLRSLLYLFKRLKLSRLPSFVASDWKADSGAGDDLYLQKFDGVYNTSKFVKILTEDEYRVTADFVKNKFRSYCILSELPSGNFSRPSSPVKGAPMDEFEDGFPVFRDYKDRKAKNFRFNLLPLEAVTVAFITTVLINSDIYVEHKLGVRNKYQLALKAVTLTVNRDGVFDISEDEKAAIIRKYLTAVAVEVQTARIYDEYMKQKGIRPPSPVKSLASTLTLVEPLNSLLLEPKPRRLSPLKSTTNLRSRSSSPTKLRSKPSVSKLKLEELYNPVASPKELGLFPGLLLGLGLGLFLGLLPGLPGLNISDEDREIDREIWAKCLLAVNDKILREKIAMSRRK